MLVFDHKERGGTLLENRHSTSTGGGIVRLIGIRAMPNAKSILHIPAEIQGSTIEQEEGHEGPGGFDLL